MSAKLLSVKTAAESRKNEMRKVNDELNETAAAVS